MLNDIFNHISAIATLTKVAIFCVIFLPLLFFYSVIRSAREKKNNASVLHNFQNSPRILLKVKSIRLMHETLMPNFYIILSVNGFIFRFPDGDNNWILSPEAMDLQSMELPIAEIYQMRFVVVFRSGEQFEGGPVTARGIVAVANTIKLEAHSQAILPIAEEYKLYYLVDGSRDLSTKAILQYEIFTE